MATIHTKDDEMFYGFDPITGEVLYREPVASSNKPQSGKRKIDWAVMEMFARDMPNKPYDVLKHIALKELDANGKLGKSLRQVCLDLGVDYDETRKSFKKFKIDSSMYPVLVSKPYIHKKNLEL